MKRVTGIGGIFLKAGDPEKMYSWYAEHLGIEREDPSSACFHWREAGDAAKKGMTVWSIFPDASTYFDRPVMLNYRVANLDELLEALAAEGVRIDPKRDDSAYGKFAWIFDPEGNRIELWEPPPE